MHIQVDKPANLQVYRQLGRVIWRALAPEPMLKKVVDIVGWHFDLDRCIGMLMVGDGQEAQIVAEFVREPRMPIGNRIYQVRLNSEWHKLLLEGRPLPLKDLAIASGEVKSATELDQLIVDTGSQSLIAFPLVEQGKLIGCLSMHFCQQMASFPSDLLELGEAIVEELSLAIGQVRNNLARELESLSFRSAQLPILLLDSDSLRIEQANHAAKLLFSHTVSGLIGDELLESLPKSDLKRLHESVDLIKQGQGIVGLDKVVLRTTRGETALTSCYLSAVDPDVLPNRLLLLCLPGMPNSCYAIDKAQGLAVDAKVNELISELSQQLHWERVYRHIASAIASSYDRDAILQTAVDSLARVFGATRGLIVKTDGPASPLILHEFVVPDLSPLGLGRTSQFPPSAVACFKARTLAFADLSSLTNKTELAQADCKHLLEKGVSSMVGCPVMHHGQHHNLIIVLQNDKPRQWTSGEMDLLEMVAKQTAVSLVHSHSYAQLKDQLFNMNLMGNLTQQLTNLVDLTVRSEKAEKQVEPARTNTDQPLSVRELEVLKLIASGLSNREIAQRLFLTESTVELHASRIRKKLKLKSRTALVKYACDNHLV